MKTLIVSRACVSPELHTIADVNPLPRRASGALFFYLFYGLPKLPAASPVKLSALSQPHLSCFLSRFLTTNSHTFLTRAQTKPCRTYADAKGSRKVSFSRPQLFPDPEPNNHFFKGNCYMVNVLFLHWNFSRPPQTTACSSLR